MPLNLSLSAISLISYFGNNKDVEILRDFYLFPNRLDKKDRVAFFLTIEKGIFFIYHPFNGQRPEKQNIEKIQEIYSSEFLSITTKEMYEKLPLEDFEELLQNQFSINFRDERFSSSSSSASEDDILDDFYLCFGEFIESIMQLQKTVSIPTNGKFYKKFKKEISLTSPRYFCIADHYENAYSESL